MPRTILTLIVLILFFISPASGQQKLEPPKLDPTPLTAQQRQLVQQGVALHDKDDYDGAISRYEEVIKENPNNSEVLYEIAYSYFMKKDYSKSLDFAYKATQFKSELLPIVYVLIGNTYDEAGDSKKSIETYKAGIKLQPSSFLLYYNLGITYSRAEQFDDARAALKKAAGLNPKHASSQIILSSLFFKGDYKTPALLSACRFLILEPNSTRADAALQIVQKVMQAGVAPGKNSNEINIFVDMAPKKKDEGDFSSVDMFMGLAKAGNYTEKNKDKSEFQLAVDNFQSLFAFLEEAKGKDQSKFTWKYYVPYFLEMHKKGYVEPFVYYIYQRHPLPGAKDWIQQNSGKVREFLSWTAGYSWPQAD
jgi:tetratricopeptide (TPR) repeat protein